MTKRKEQKEKKVAHEPADASGSEICQQPAKWLGRIRYAARALRDPSVRRYQVRFSACRRCSQPRADRAGHLLVQEDPYSMDADGRAQSIYRLQL